MTAQAFVSQPKRRVGAELASARGSMTTPAQGGGKLLPYMLWCAAFAAAATLFGPFAAPAAAQGSRALVFEEALRGAEDREVRWPVAVAASAAEELAVADAFGPRLLVLRRAGVGWQVARVAELPGAPAGLAWDGSRWVVSVRGGGGLVALEGEELLQRRLPLPAGVVPGALAALPGGGLLVHDAAGGRILRLGADGRSAGEIAVPGTVTGLAAAPGAVVAAFGDEGVVRRFDAAGAVEATWALPGDGPVPAWPAGIAVAPAGDTYVADRHNGRIAVLDPAGRVTGFGARKGWDPGLLLFPSGLALLPDGRLVVADQGNGRVQVFRRAGGGS
jgi:sugar lactone lactonase YvrE